MEKDVIGVTGDGANVMVAFGKLFNFTYNLCWNHAIHLGVSDVIYKDFDKSLAFNFMSQTETADEAVDEIYVEGKNENEVLGDSDDSEYEDSSDCEDDSDDDEDLNQDTYGDIVSRMRKIIRLFKSSPVRNCVLQKYVKKQFGKEFSIFLDTKTRWNSLYDTITRFLFLSDCIMQSLSNKDINQPKLWSNKDTEILKVKYTRM